MSEQWKNPETVQETIVALRGEAESWRQDVGEMPMFDDAANWLEKARVLIRDLVDEDDCWFDHHGGCQAHGYLSLEPGQLCPHAEAKKEWLS